MSKISGLVIWFYRPFLILLASGVLLSCRGPSEKPPLAEICLGILNTPDSLPLAVAHSEGLFGSEGVNVKLIYFQSAMERDSAFQANQCQGMASDLVCALLMHHTNTKVCIARLTGGEKTGDGRICLLAAPLSTIKRTVDLKHVPIAVAQSSVVEYVTEKILQQEGLKKSEIETSSIPKIHLRISMLLQNQIAAAALAEPLATYAIQKGARLILNDKNYNYSQHCLIYRRHLLKTDLNALKAINRALNTAVNRINAQPEKYRQQAIALMQVPASTCSSFKLTAYPYNTIPTQKQLSSVFNWLKEKERLSSEVAYEDIVTDVCLDPTPC